MRVIVLDIETTGLDPESCQVLSVGMVDYDTEQPVDKSRSIEYFVSHEEIHGDPFAILMNGDTIRKCILESASLPSVELMKNQERVRPHMLLGVMVAWIGRDSKELTWCGKNVAGFDLPFLACHSKKESSLTLCPYDYTDLSQMFKHRVLDIGSLYAQKTDTCVPSLSQCLGRAGLRTEVAHTALGDCWACVWCLERHFNKEG